MLLQHAHMVLRHHDAVVAEDVAAKPESGLGALRGSERLFILLAFIVVEWGLVIQDGIDLLLDIGFIMHSNVLHGVRVFLGVRLKQGLFEHLFVLTQVLRFFVLH